MRLDPPLELEHGSVPKVILVCRLSSPGEREQDIRTMRSIR